MKQRKFGKKVVNWHKPFNRSQPRQRILRKRDNDILDLALNDLADYFNNYWVEDEYWNIYDPGCSSNYLDIADWDEYELDRFLYDVLNPPELFCFDLDIRDVENWNSEDELTILTFSGSEVSSIEARLFDYIEKLENFKAYSTEIKSCINVAIGDSFFNIDILKSWSKSSQYFYRGHSSRNVVGLICLFSPFWIRSPRTWNQDSGASLLDHLFVVHDVPRFLYREWFFYNAWFSSYNPRYKWLCWFILLGQGGSLKKASEKFSWNIANRFQHFLSEISAEISPTEACIFAEIKRLGGSQIEFERIKLSRAFIIDPTEQSEIASFGPFWEETVRWLISYRNDITHEESHLILSWAMHEYTESERAGQSFSWKGRRPRRVLERSIEYHRQLERPWSGYKWQGHSWNWVFEEDSQSKWSFIELTTGEELFLESQFMHHCVSSYAGRCASGYSAIVSMQHNDIKCITIEVNPLTKQIVQARGACNRAATTEEQRAISRWRETILYPNTSE